jgi:uncharacterized protein involved in outer membrane biogenesis
MCSVRRVIQIVLGTVAVLIVIVGAALLYLSNADLSVYEDRIEAMVSTAIGHNFEVAGRFELQFGAVLRLVAEDLSLQNPHWASGPDLVRVGRVSMAIDTFSLLSGPLVIEELDVRDVEGRLEVSAGRRANWTPAVATQERSDVGGLDLDRIAFRRVSIDSIGFSYVDSQRPRPIRLEISSLGVSPDANDILDLDLQGTINGLALWADGKLGPWQNFLDGKDITADLDLTLGAVRLSVGGSAEDLPYLQGISLRAELHGPDVGRVIDRLGLPPFASGPFEVEAQITKLDGGHQVRADGNLGAIDVLASGTVDRFIATQRAELDFSVAGPDAQYVAELFGVKGAPAGAFHIAGGLALDGERLIFTDTQASVGSNIAVVNGEIEFGDSFLDAELSIDAHGPDFSVIGPFFGLPGLPTDTFAVAGNLKKNGALWQANSVEASVGEIRVTADGALTAGSRDDSRISFRAIGPDLAVLQAATGLQGLPPGAFDIAATLRSDPRGIGVDDAVGIFGDNRLELSGILTNEAGFQGTSLRVSATGPELADMAVLTGVPHVPAGPFEIAGELHIDDDWLVFDSLVATVGDLTGSATANVGLGAYSGDFRLQFTLSGPDAAQFKALPWLEPFSGESFRVAGVLETEGADLDLTEVELQIGDFRLSADGTLSLSPMSNDSDLAFSVAGPSLGRVGLIFGSDALPNKPFEIAGEVVGTPVGFAMRRFGARVGENDIEGEFSADLREKPRVTGRLMSAFLDLREPLKPLVEPEQESSQAPKEKGDLFFSDEPIDGALLKFADVDLELQVARLRTNTFDVSDFLLVAKLFDGDLRIEPITMSQGAGRFSGRLRFSPEDDGYLLDTTLEADNLHLGLAASEEQVASTLPPISGSIALRGSGSSVHQIMASANGRIALRQGKGQVKEFIGAVMFRDVVLEALRTINPMRKKQTTRTLDCGIYDVSLIDGLATLDEVAIQTDQLLFVATGSLDLRTESLNVNFRAKPREGLGVSLGTLANSFLGVRGTLDSPRVTVDPKGSITTTGAAVATGGLSLLARGVWDRLSAARSICEDKTDAKRTSQKE